MTIMAENRDLNPGDMTKNPDASSIMSSENGLEDEPDFSDPEDFVDDISDEGGIFF